MLTDTKVKGLKPKAKNYKISDSGGLYLDVRTSGAKYWRQNYRYNGKQKTLAHGVYPTITLSRARQLRDKANKALSDGKDPAKEKLTAKIKRTNTFELLAREWFDKNKEKWSEKYASKVIRSMERDLFPFLGDEPIEQIAPSQLLGVLRKVEKRGAYDIAGRLRQRCDGVFRYAFLTDRMTQNPASQLQGVLKTRKVQHQKALDRKTLPSFLDELKHCDGHPVRRQNLLDRSGSSIREYPVHQLS